MLMCISLVHHLYSHRNARKRTRWDIYTPLLTQQHIVFSQTHLPPHILLDSLSVHHKHPHTIYIQYYRATPYSLAMESTNRIYEDHIADAITAMPILNYSIRTNTFSNRNRFAVAALCFWSPSQWSSGEFRKSFSFILIGVSRTLVRIIMTDISLNPYN